MSIQSESSLFEAIDALIAYDEGATDSGINDAEMRKEVQEKLLAMNEEEFRKTLAGFVRTYYLSPDALSKGYGLQEVKFFIDWLASIGVDI